MDAVPSMVQRSGDTLIVRSVVSGNPIYLDQEPGANTSSLPTIEQQLERFRVQQQLAAAADLQNHSMPDSDADSKDEGLPQCKIKRNYSCSYCTYFTQNPRCHLTHLRDVHGEKIVINKCKLCLYASRHYQKLVRHMKMVHGSTEGIEDNGQARKRQIGRDARKRKIETSAMSLLSQHMAAVASQQQQHTIQELTAQATPSQPQQCKTLPKVDSPPALLDDSTQNRILKCSVCEFTTLYREVLVEHEREQHYKTKFFRCEKCSYVTHIKARFSKHVKYHSMPMIKCNACDFRTPYKWNLDRHMKNHGGSGTFKCAACDFTADIKQSLTVHEMNHHVPPVGHAAGMNLTRRRNRVGGSADLDDFLSDAGDMEMEAMFNNNNNNIDDFEEHYGKKCKYDEDDDQPTDLSQKGSSHDLASIGGAKKPVRPVPNLIPIHAASSTALNLSKDLAESTTSIKDIASMFFPEIVLRMEKSSHESVGAGTQLSPSSTNSSTTSKRKVTNFFDKLKESFAEESGRNENLICGCGHISKCLSESIIHRKSCSSSDDEKHSSPSPINLSLTNSTRCQYCRHRCKSSADLLNHLKNCVEAGMGPNDSYDSMSGSSGGRQEYDDDMDEMMKHHHPMENRVFVWNKMPEMSGGSSTHSNQNGSVNGDSPGKKSSVDMKSEDNRYYGVETAPGYGEITKKMTSEEEATNSSLKKVYKCPHCSFWASTASRFHVHIVGHLNKKPFECSLCAYRSNWRWDITKHIRLKTIRDPGHKNARVLMNDETGRRNYTKYNKYITLMKVTEEDGDPKLMKSGEMTPNQEASLAFLNDYKNAGKHLGDAGSSPSHLSESGEMACNNNNNNSKNIDQNGILRIFHSPVDAGHHESGVGCDKRSPPPLIKPSDDLITDVKQDGAEKKTFYKCRKCNYRHGNRDAVLAHVKIHYQMPAPLQVAVNQNAYMNNVFAAMCLSQQSPLPLVSGGVDNNGGGNNNNNQHPLLTSGLLQQAIASSNLGQTSPAGKLLSGLVAGGKSNASSSSAAAASAIVKSEHGEADEASSSVVVGGATTSAPSTTATTTSAPPGSSATTSSSGMLSGGTGTGSTPVMGQLTSGSNNNTENDWRGPAPYRCGHCHQVSNWKHVIQRHCRLKHAGDIRIETVDRSSDRQAPVYRPLHNNGQSHGHLGGDASKSPGKSHSTNTENVLTPSTALQMMQSYDQLMQKYPSESSDQSPDESHNGGGMLGNECGAMSKIKQQQCPLCPFISESKSQMNYHISLHKGNQYECNLCGYICTKKQQLSAHHRSCHEEDNSSSAQTAYMKSLGIVPESGASSSDHRSKTTDDDEESSPSSSIISFCPKCPSRFLAISDLQRHLKQHTAALMYKCEACDFSTKLECNLLSHSFAHTSAYQNKTEQLCKSYQENPDYPCPHIRKFSMPNTGAEFWVVRTTTHEANSQSNTFRQSTSLLKKQLETGSKPASPPPPAEVERCLYCPFDTTSADLYKDHLQNHFAISKCSHEFTCDHCDFSASDGIAIKDHIKVHFKAIHQNKVSFFTSYDNLELSVCKEHPAADVKPDKFLVYKSNNKNSNLINNNANSNHRRRSSRCSSNSNNNGNSCNEENVLPQQSQHRTILVDAKTGQVISRN